LTKFVEKKMKKMMIEEEPTPDLSPRERRFEGEGERIDD